MLLTHDFRKSHEHTILNIELYVQCCSVVYTLNFWKIDLEIFHLKMELQAAFKAISKISKT